MPRWRVYRLVQIAGGLLFRLFHAVNRASCGLFLFRLKTVGAESVRGLRGPVIVVSNHKSYLDHFFLLAAVPFRSRLLPARAVAADFLFRIPALACALKHLLGAYPARRGQGAATLREPMRILEKGYVVLIYPEGGRVKGPGVSPMHSGAALLAIKTGAPVLPVAIRGLERSSFWSFWFGQRMVTVVFGTPFFADRAKTKSEVTADIQEAVGRLYFGS